MNKKYSTNFFIITIILCLVIFVYINKNNNKNSFNIQENKYSSLLKISAAKNKNNFEFIKYINTDNIDLDTLDIETAGFLTMSAFMNNREDFAEKVSLKFYKQDSTIFLATLIYRKIKEEKFDEIEQLFKEAKIPDELEDFKWACIAWSKKDNEADFNKYLNKISKDGSHIKNSLLGLKAEENEDLDKALTFYEKSLDERYLLTTLLNTANIYDLKGDEENYEKTMKKQKQLINISKQMVKNSSSKNFKNRGFSTIYNTFFEGKRQAFLEVAPYFSYKISPEFDLSLLFTATIFAKSNNFEISNRLLEEIKEDKSYYFLSQELYAENLLKQNQYKKALKILKDLKKSDKLNTSSYLNMAKIYEKEGNIKKAIEIYDNLIENNKYSKYLPTYYFNRGVLHNKNNNWERAETDLEKGVETGYITYHSLNYLGYSWITKYCDANESGIYQEKINKGLAFIKKSLELNPVNASIIDSLAWGLYKTYSLNEAVLFSEVARSLNPTNSVINYHLGDIYMDLQRNYEAVYQWEKALYFNEKDNLLEEKDVKDINKKIKKYK